MLSMLLLSPVPHLYPQVILQSASIRRLPSLKNAILKRGSLTRGRLVGGTRVSERKSLMELAGIDRFRRVDEVEGSGCGEEETVLKKQHPDMQGFESTLNRLSKWLVAALFGLVILWKHDAEAMWAAMGSVLNAWFSTKLKQILNQERPSSLRSDPGMPSSHSQSIFYAAGFTVLSLIDLMGINVFPMFVCATTLICASYLSWLRVSQHLHTVSQILVGAGLGFACSLMWYWMWHSFVLEAFLSSVWVRIFVVLSSVSFCLAFLVYIVRNWLQDEI
ncbi:dolichyldiphosphatase [Apostasia shenzhenica]|uniref:Dolichyldiphosphatase n=1 Tax=Apostasia shenzhenica TaxID=1088818 RepID=A0A2I0AMD8_9ASPA|nr:dolichyldiphosphatase [Apostasia shenzhenica]